MTNPIERAGSAKFRGYVQRVAFQLTLSEPMIRMLRVVRDYPPHQNNQTNQEHKENWGRTNMKDGYHADLFIKEIRALENRGLAYYNPPPKNNPWPEGHIFYKLTREGELVAELLVYSGLMQPKPIVGFQDNVA